MGAAGADDNWEQGLKKRLRFRRLEKKVKAYGRLLFWPLIVEES
jgi:hypothetical protein